MDSMICIYSYILFVIIRDIACTDDNDLIITFKPANVNEIEKYCALNNNKDVYNLVERFINMLNYHLFSQCDVTECISTKLASINLKRPAVKCLEEQSKSISDYIHKKISLNCDYCGKTIIECVENLFNDDNFFSRIKNGNSQLSLSKHKLLTLTYYSRCLQSVILCVFYASKLESELGNMKNVTVEKIEKNLYLREFKWLLDTRSKLLTKQEDYILLPCEDDIYKKLNDSLIKYYDAFLLFMNNNKRMINKLIELVNKNSTDREFFECVGYNVADNTVECNVSYSAPPSCQATEGYISIANTKDYAFLNISDKQKIMNKNDTDKPANLDNEQDYVENINKQRSCSDNIGTVSEVKVKTMQQSRKKHRYSKKTLLWCLACLVTLLFIVLIVVILFVIKKYIK